MTFFHDLRPMQQLAEIVHLDNYVNVPEDWYVALTDVRNSTQAIEEGRYKAVNTVAAVTITAVLNLLPELEVPFLFGGDGAALVVPPEIKERVLEALAAIKWMAKQNFDLEVRAGLIPVAVVMKAGYEIKVGKLHVSDNHRQPMFTGEGLEYADRLLKSADGGAYLVEASADARADLTGYECRWSKHPAAQEEVLSLLVKVTYASFDKRGKIYEQIIQKIDEIYGDHLERHPIRIEQMAVSKSLRQYYHELGWKKERVGWRDLFSLMFWSIAGFILWRYVQHSWDRYKQAVHGSTDHEKFDDLLRMTISGTKAQRKELRDYLDVYRQLGQIIYGMHTAQHSLMTCIVFDRFGRQVHFLDADEGGYAMAAKQMKAQLATHSQETMAHS